MEHSRLLKFLTDERYRTIMSEPPTIKVKKEYETPPNITAEVPGEQKIREMTTTEDAPNTSTEIADTEYTLSPVITVTKKETTLTKGDMKLQKVTVSEDIAAQEMENGGHSISYAESQVTVQTSRQAVSHTITSGDVTETVIDKDERSHQEKRSRIPKLKFRQTVEKVKQERREQKSKDQAKNIPRRSSIPKLKDAKLVKRQTSINSEAKVEETLAEAEAQILDEFDKIYDEIIDDPQKEIDDKILAVKIDDPVKVETKFEEIIHAYDSNDDTYFTPTEKIKLSKIPWRRKDDGGYRTGASADRTKSNHSTVNLRDGGFKVSATTITTKRFSRGNSTDLSNTQRVDIVELKDGPNEDQEVIRETIVTETIESAPIKAKVISRGIKREISLDSGDDVKAIKKVEESKDNTEETVIVEEFENGRRVTKETITRQNIRTGIPIKSERINRSISKELNRRPPSLDDRDFVNRKVVKHEGLKDGSNKTITKETYVKETPVKSEKITRGISRTFSRDGKSVTVSSKPKEMNSRTSKMITEDNVDLAKAEPSKALTKDDKPDTKQEIVKTNINTKEVVKKGIPVLKTTHSYSKGQIQNVEISKTIEWTAADEIRTKSYVRSYSENKKEVNDKKFAPTVIKKEAIIDTKLSIEHKPITEKFEHTPSDDNSDVEIIEIEENEQSIKNIGEITPPRNQMDVDENLNNIIIITEPTETITEISPTVKEPEDNNLPEQDKDNNIPPVTILKGNVSRLITQISVKEEPDVSKKEIDVEEDLPKKKTVLSKIAMFEGKEPAEFNIKIKKCVIGKRAQSSVSKENTDEVPKIIDHVLKRQPRYDSKGNLQKVEISAANEQIREIKNEPVIVDQIWKVQDQSIETISVVQVEDVKILPAAIDFTVSESSFETAQRLPGKLDFDTNIKHTEDAKILPGKIDFNVSQNQVDPIKTLPSKLDFEHSTDQIEEPHILPGKIDFERDVREPAVIPTKIDIIPKEYQNDVTIKYSPEKVEYTDEQNQADKKKPRIGKLDLNFWQKKVEDNKKVVGTFKNTKNQSYIETQKIVPVTVVFETDLSEVESPKLLPGRIEIKSDDKTEMPTIVPGHNYLTPDINQNEPLKSEIITNEKQLQVPVVLPETPLTKQTKMDFETQQSHIEIPVILPGKIELTPPVDKFETPTILPENINFKIHDNDTEITQNMLPERVDYTIKQPQNESPKILPGKIDLIYHENKVEIVKALPGKIDNTANETQFKTAKILPGRIDFKANENKVEITKPLPGRIDLSSYENVKPKECNNNLNQDVRITPDKQTSSKINNETDDPDIEIPSDPELVDSEPEIKETKETIMSKLKNKIYFIANKSKNKSTIDTSLTTTIENDLNTDSTKIENNDSNVSSLEYISRDNLDSKSDVEIGRTDNNTREEMKRAKSLAELDLGDAVKGQVQRMVYRIKSVDFEKTETPRGRKISVKEMPRKSSVLEKIALFEGKAVSTRWEKRDKSATTTAKFETTTKIETRTSRFETRTPNVETRTTFETTTAVSLNSTRSSLNEVGLSLEELYLQRVEDLSTAKVRYGKTDMLYLRLSNGDQMPAIALGTALMDTRIASNIVCAAIDLGFRAIDTAYIYGTEKEVGDGIKMKINDGTVKREDLYIMSKLWSTFHHPDLVEPACRASLEALGLEYFDLLMIHNPMSFKEGGDPVPKIASVLQFSKYDYLDAWFGMEKLVAKGLVKNLGVSNFNSKQVQRILDKGKIKPVVNQVECHPYLSQQRLQTFCIERNITLSCFGVLGSKGTPAAFKSSTDAIIDDPMVKVMASGLNVTAAQLLVRYQIQSGRNVAVKASSAAHLWDVLQALTFELKQHEIDALHAMNKGRRTFTLKGMGETHKNYPFNEPF